MPSASHESNASNPSDRAGPAGDLSRRDFVAMTAAGVLATGTSGMARAASPVVESDVIVTTPDGQCDAAYFHPASGKHPGVLVWCDAFGLRPSMRAIGRRLAAEGYAVLVPNPYYRIGKAPFYETASKVDFKDDATWKKLRPLMASVKANGAAERDATAYVAFLDAQPQVDTAKKIGTQGYCMGGALVVRTAAAVPMRIGAGGSFHGGSLVTDQPDSPHLLASKIDGHMYFAIAQSDDAQQPDAKDKLREAFAAAKVPTGIDVYPTLHGWCVNDMPMQDGKPIYDEPEAEKAWGHLMNLYKTALV